MPGYIIQSFQEDNLPRNSGGSEWDWDKKVISKLHFYILKSFLSKAHGLNVFLCVCRYVCVCVCLCVSVCVWLSVTALSLSFPVSATLLNSVAQLSKVENVLKQQEELN